MRPTKPRRLLDGLVAALLLAGCSKPDPTIILGNWKADSFAVNSLMVPLGPNFEVTRSHLILKSPDGVPIQTFALSQIRGDKDKIELEFRDALGISLVFMVERADRVHFSVPFMGTDIAFTKQP